MSVGLCGQFKYIFEDDKGNKSELMIEDWETGALYWNMLKRTSNENEACEAVKKKYLDDFARAKDLYFHLGTHFENHLRKFRNPFIIRQS